VDGEGGGGAHGAAEEVLLWRVLLQGGTGAGSSKVSPRRCRRRRGYCTIGAAPARGAMRPPSSPVTASFGLLSLRRRPPSACFPSGEGLVRLDNDGPRSRLIVLKKNNF
jgi:hypothetical protein